MVKSNEHNILLIYRINLYRIFVRNIVTLKNICPPEFNISALQAYGKVIAAPQWPPTLLALPEHEPVPLCRSDRERDRLSLLSVCVRQEVFAELHKSIADDANTCCEGNFWKCARRDNYLRPRGYTVTRCLKCYEQNVDELG